LRCSAASGKKGTISVTAWRGRSLVKYKARARGFTDVPVRQGNAAVVTTQILRSGRDKSDSAVIEDSSLCVVEASVDVSVDVSVDAVMALASGVLSDLRSLVAAVLLPVLPVLIMAGISSILDVGCSKECEGVKV